MKARHRQAGVEKLAKVTCVRRQKPASCHHDVVGTIRRGGTAPREQRYRSRSQERREIDVDLEDRALVDDGSASAAARATEH